MEQIVLAQRRDGSLNHQTTASMYRFRHDVFHDRLGWDVVSDNGMEHDEFDELDPVYVLAKRDLEVRGCCRLLPTTGPYMLKDTFPQLLHGQTAPQRDDVWELSRFAITTLGYEGEMQGFGFNGTPVEIMQMLYRFAKANGIKQYLAVTTVAIERLLSKLGVTTNRLGPPIKIGKVRTVSCAIEVDSLTEFAIFGAFSEHTQKEAA